MYDTLYDFLTINRSTAFQTHIFSVFCNESHIIAAFPGSSVTVGPLLPQNSGWGIGGDGPKSGFPISEITLFPSRD